MDAFEFLFSFFGLLLGLSVAEIAAGFSRTYDRRKVYPVSWLGPILAVVLLLDLASFWVGAWQGREAVTVNFRTTINYGVVGLLYYFAATQVFPREGANEALDTHVMAHRKAVAFSVIASNIIMFGPGFLRPDWTIATLINLGVNLIYFGLLVTVALARSQRVVTGALMLTAGFLLAGLWND